MEPDLFESPTFGLGECVATTSAAVHPESHRPAGESRVDSPLISACDQLEALEPHSPTPGKEPGLRS